MKIESGHWKTHKIFGMVLFRDLFFVQIFGYAVWLYRDRVSVVMEKLRTDVEGVQRL